MLISSDIPSAPENVTVMSFDSATEGGTALLNFFDKLSSASKNSAVAVVWDVLSSSSLSDIVMELSVVSVSLEAMSVGWNPVN